MVCSNCGATLGKGDRFCISCGTMVPQEFVQSGESSEQSAQPSYTPDPPMQPVEADDRQSEGNTSGVTSIQEALSASPVVQPSYTPDPPMQPVEADDRQSASTETGSSVNQFGGGTAQGMGSPFRDAPAQQIANTAAGAGMMGNKAVIIAACVIGAFVLGFVAIIGIKGFKSNKKKNIDRETEALTGVVGTSEDVADAGVSDETDGSLQADVAGDAASSGAFETKDYWNELSEDQRVRLYCVLSSVYNVQEPRLMVTGERASHLPSDFSEPLTTTDLELAYAAYCIVISPGFSHDYSFGTVGERTYTASIPKPDMDALLDVTIKSRIEDPGSINGGSCIVFENGSYLASLLDDWVYGYTGLLKIEQTGPDEVMIYGVTGLGHMHYYFENSYNPYDWDYSRDYEDDGDYTSLYHSYRAKAQINPESPCGLTILGMSYDDPDSTAVAKEAGFDTQQAATSIEQGQVDIENGEYDPTEWYMIPDSDTRKLTNSDIIGYNADQLRIARNEIYARHGRKFQDEQLQTYFNAMPWYVGYIDPDNFTDEMLSDVERENAEFLKKAEKKLK